MSMYIEGPNKVFYPPKNGPIAVAKRLNIPIDKIPEIDPNDELLGDSNVFQKISAQHEKNSCQLAMMGFDDKLKNLRYLMRINDLQQVIQSYFRASKFQDIFIGDRVVRGPDWKWGNQDGGAGLEGTVRGLRQWHPKDPPNVTTEVVVLWDHGLYGNYRFGYKSAFDVKVIDRLKKNKLKQISIGQCVQRSQINWRWGDQDGGQNEHGTVIELYASPAPFEGGARVAVLWDHEKHKYKQLATEYLKNHPNGDEEWMYDADDEKGYNLNDGAQDLDIDYHERWKQFTINPHKVRRKRKKFEEQDIVDSGDDTSDWDETDFEERLCQPIVKYRWSLPDSKSDFGVAMDLEITQKNDMVETRYLMIDDRVERSKYFKPLRRKPKSTHGIVLRVEQQDPRRVNVEEIKGDKIFTTWSSYQSYKFNSNDGKDDVLFFKRGHIFGDEWNKIKVGDRVKRGITWKKEWGNEDNNGDGTVVAIQYSLQCFGIIAKVKWNKTEHINFYSWGFKDIYDLKISNAESNYQSFLMGDSLSIQQKSNESFKKILVNKSENNCAIQDIEEYDDTIPDISLMSPQDTQNAFS